MLAFNLIRFAKAVSHPPFPNLSWVDEETCCTRCGQETTQMMKYSPWWSEQVPQLLPCTSFFVLRLPCDATDCPTLKSACIRATSRLNKVLVLVEQ